MFEQVVQTQNKMTLMVITLSLTTQECVKM